MSKIIVSKYGGSSSASPETVEIKRKITSDDSRRQIIVLSAHGKVGQKKKDTDMLIELAKTKESSIIINLIDKAKGIYPNLADSHFEEIKTELTTRVLKDLSPNAYEDDIKSFGEYMCAKLSSKVLGYEFIDPKELFLVSTDYGRAKILPESERMIRERLLDKKGPFIVPGFYGFTKEGTIATLSRGGSDLTGAYIASALEAELYENFTDQLGILVADPRIIDKPKKIDEITFEEIRDLAYSGFSVFHEEAMKPVGDKSIPVHLRSTFEYPREGTYIVPDRIVDLKRPLVGVAYKGGLCSFEISAFGLNDSLGVGRRILSTFEDNKVPVEFVTTGIDDFGVIVRENYLARHSKVGEIIGDLTSCMDGAKVEFKDGMGSLVVAGKGLRGNKGISADIQRTLADSGVNIRFISQGPRERCIVYGINADQESAAVNAIHDKYLK
jgi:aspartate kinase